MHHIAPGVRGPWLRPWTEISGFRIFHLVSWARQNRYAKLYASTIPGSALDYISPGVRDPWLHPWTETFDFCIFFHDKPYDYTKFKHSKPFGSTCWEFPQCFPYFLGAPGSATGQKFWVYGF